MSGRVSGSASGFLAPIVFASIGLDLDLGAVTAIPVFLAPLILCAFAGKLIGSGAVARAGGMERHEAMSVGMGRSGRGAG